MKIKRAYKFRLDLDRTKENLCSRSCGSSRFVWNKALAEIKDQLDKKEFSLNYAGLCKKITSWKKEVEINFLKKIHSQVLQQSAKDLDRAIKDFFKKKKGFPKFKKKNEHDSFRYPQGFKIKGNRILLPKIGLVKFRKSQEILGTPKNVTVSKRAGKWYVAIQVEQEIKEPKHKYANKEIALDLGISKLATFSDGSVLKPHNAYRKRQEKLAREQRKLSRKKKGSNNRKKQIFKLQKFHKKTSDSRLDYLHKASTWITKNHGVIYLEDLKVANMSKSAKGTKEAPGRNVRAKSGLNKSILDQGWYEFKRQIQYKSDWFGGKVVLVNPKYTSQTCSECGYKDKENRQTQAKFVCKECGHKDNADINAAKNILTVGQTGLACGDIRRTAV